MKTSKKKNRKSGQALTEYVLLLAMIAGASSILFEPMKDFLAILEKPIREDFKYAYKYGDPKACGYDDTEAPCTGSPTRHPRYSVSDNFRMVGRGRQ
jgi:hypothetical protein